MENFLDNFLRNSVKLSYEKSPDAELVSGTPANVSSEFAGRRRFVLVLMLSGMLMLVGRAIDLQVFNKHFLQKQASLRHVTQLQVSAYRGEIVDRNGMPLAISTPIQSVGLDPQRVNALVDKDAVLARLAGLLKMPQAKLDKIVIQNNKKRFVYIKRRINPVLVEQIKSLQIPGVDFTREFKRFYPFGEVTAHLLGFNDVDDKGQAGLELSFQSSLQGIPGSKRVIRDGRGRTIADVEDIKTPLAGHDLELSIDQRLQYLAYRELKAAVKKHHALSASLVILDAKSGDVLAAVNQPSFNPNSRKNLIGKLYRNRAITDVFEPGSTVKPFVVACALDAGFIDRDYRINTHPGWLRVGRNLVRDIHNYGNMDLTRILQKSSNVAVSQIALTMPEETFWRCFQRLGFGESAGVGFPGEASGHLLGYQTMRKFEQATLSFGYGLSTSVLQLARAYTVFADAGKLHSVSLLKREHDLDYQQVISPEQALFIRQILERVVEKNGTAYQARVEGYRVAGKTGTVKKASAGGYASDRYFAVFVGMAPASDPKLIIAVLFDEPNAGQYYGGQVAGPVFSRVMAGALRVLGVPHDQENSMPILLAKQSD